MELTIKFSPGEMLVLQANFEDNREVLRERWHVRTLEQYVALLTMHGLDHGAELSETVS